MSASREGTSAYSGTRDIGWVCWFSYIHIVDTGLGLVVHLESPASPEIP